MNDIAAIITFAIYFGIILLTIMGTQIYQGYLKEIGKGQFFYDEWNDILFFSIFWPAYLLVAIVALPFTLISKYVGALIARIFIKK